MKRIYTSIIFLFAMAAVLPSKTKVTVVPGDRHAETSFAIITENRTWTECREELEAYRDVLQQEGLATTILAADWKDPQEVRDRILKLNARGPRLEGIVLVGDMPVVMVREAQFMTSAFKMNEKTFPEFESSVPSDRFYDDFDLQFDFIKKDSLRSDVFYYRLSEEGSQVLCPDIYSARMKVPAMMEGDKYEIMRKYLRKVVKAHQQTDPLDRFSFFAGHGYNSDCLTIWRQKPVVFRENFPYAFQKASQNKFLNFRQKDKMKTSLAAEMQRKGTDVFLFSEHGAPDTQYLNGTGRADNFRTCYDQLKRSVASWFRRYKGTPDEEAFLHEVVDSVYQLPRSCVSDSALVVAARLDSVESADANMTLEDLRLVRSNAKMVILNACYNGSFHNEEGYVAGFHVFGDGDCVVAQGNTVNVLQDKWEDKLIGMLSIGERAGMWQKEIQFLESHMIGDPTFRFTPHDAAEQELCRRLHHDLVFHSGEASVWKSYLESGHPLLRSAGITHLSYLDGDCSAEALELLRNDPSWNVRLHALNALSHTVGDRFVEGVELALGDPCEAVVRTACRMAGASCREEFRPMLSHLDERHPDMARVAFTAETSLKVLTPGTHDSYMAVAADDSLPDVKRISAIRMFRNNRVPEAVSVLEQVIMDDGASEELRTVAAEAAGWYNQSSVRLELAGRLSSYLGAEGKKLPVQVRQEVLKTVARLEWK